MIFTRFAMGIHEIDEFDSIFDSPTEPKTWIIFFGYRIIFIAITSVSK